MGFRFSAVSWLQDVGGRPGASMTSLQVHAGGRDRGGWASMTASFKAARNGDRTAVVLV